MNTSICRAALCAAALAAAAAATLAQRGGPLTAEPGRVYKVTLQPLTTSNYFDTGHRLRIEVSSSNFPRFDRNLNTGGNNYDEVKGVVAHNVIHHSRQYPSRVTIMVVRR